MMIGRMPVSRKRAYRCEWLLCRQNDMVEARSRRVKSGARQTLSDYAKKVLFIVCGSALAGAKSGGAVLLP
eukprot:scaffold12351_cov141-Skeletonema_menzelii.AAC.6